MALPSSISLKRTKAMLSIPNETTQLISFLSDTTNISRNVTFPLHLASTKWQDSTAHDETINCGNVYRAVEKRNELANA
jgi:hypothetical protein